MHEILLYTKETRQQSKTFWPYPTNYCEQTPVQTGPGAHPASHTMGTGSSPGVKRPERDFDQPAHTQVCAALRRFGQRRKHIRRW